MDQLRFFKEVRKLLNSQKDSVAEDFISKSLKISNSGAYKKLKGITKLSIDEAHTLCDTLGISINLNATKNETIHYPYIFHCDDIVTPPATYEQWAANILNHSLLLDK